MSLSIQARRVGYVTVLDCTGRLVAGADSASLQEQVRQCMENHLGVVVNLGQVTFVDSSGLGLLVRLVATSRHSHSGLRFCEASQQVQRILELTKLNNVLDIHPTEEQALEALANRPYRKPANSGFAGSRIFCLDESVDLLAFLRESLEKAGFAAQSARSVPDAILLLRTIRPNVVIAGPHFAPKVSVLAAELQIPLICLDAEFATVDPGDAMASLLQRISETLRRGTA